MKLFVLASLLSGPFLVAGQLSGQVGPTTSLSDKTSFKKCSVLDYGAKADGETDVGPAISSAAEACLSGGVVVIPHGTYAMETFVTISGAKGMAIQLDGIIERVNGDEDNMIMIKHSSDFEFLSSTGKGAIQGNGYEHHAQGSSSGPRILRLTDVSDFSVHDLALVDSPSFHFSMDTCSNGEVYPVISQWQKITC